VTTLTTGGVCKYTLKRYAEASWNVMACKRKPEFVFQRNAWVHLNHWGHQASRLMAAEVFASAVVMMDIPCCEVVWRVLATHSIHQFPLHFPSSASCAITFQLQSTTGLSAHTILMPASDWAVHQICYSILWISNHHTLSQMHLGPCTIGYHMQALGLACQQCTNPQLQVAQES